MVWLHFLMNAAALVYGGVTDWKRREIPDTVPAFLILTGLLPGPGLVFRLLSMLAAAGVLLAAAKLSGTGLPGGDFKLLCALTFSCGIAETLAVLVLAGFGALVVSLIRRKPARRSIPLCTYAAPAYLLAGAAHFIF